VGIFRQVEVNDGVVIGRLADLLAECGMVLAAHGAINVALGRLDVGLWRRVLLFVGDDVVH